MPIVQIYEYKNPLSEADLLFLRLAPVRCIRITWPGVKSKLKPHLARGFTPGYSIIAGWVGLLDLIILE